jgi:glycosyltransferase involved in cell wall biosynthesis
MNTAMPRVSVLIPSYNRAAYLVQALESVCAQAVAPFEIIVIDDGSTDQTADVVRQFEPQVCFIRQDHLGVSAARNRGLAVAQGDLIAWLDADDVWEPTFLQTVVPLLEQNSQIGGIYTGFVHIDSQGNLLSQFSQKVVEPSALVSALTENNFIATPAMLARKTCYEQVGEFDPRLGICEDYDMWLRLASKFTISGLPAQLVRVRVHEGNTQRDTTAFARFRLAMIEKNFGAQTGDPATWPQEKRRAYAFAFQSIALRRIQDGQVEQGWFDLERGIALWPQLLDSLDIFYELACGSQFRGQRGQVDSLDIDKNGAEMLKRLDTLFAKNDAALHTMRRTAYGNTYLALGMLSDQAGRWGMARHYLQRAIRSNPRLLASRAIVRRMAKLYTGQRMVRYMRSLAGRTS